MNPILKKLGLINQNPILIIKAPDEYKEIMSGIEAEVDTSPVGQYKFIQIFAKDMDEALNLTPSASKALEEDGHIWLCYPKGASKKYKSDINREKTWEVFAPFEFEPVTQVAIDADWSAMRFKHVDKITAMKRKKAATENGKERIKENKDGK
ncbi:MAG: DUF3052 domain-containing protein [Clostridia bacterium]|nr:DUF3052 domain-containing protein [Clostridia bacterium]